MTYPDCNAAPAGINRLVHFPVGEHELVTAWLWSEQAGVISHQTALAPQGLSDVLPAQVHLTLPAARQKRRFRVPPDVVLHHADVAPGDRAWSCANPREEALEPFGGLAA
jgi:predicted transcriptional regulator of viral defense system